MGQELGDSLPIGTPHWERLPSTPVVGRECAAVFGRINRVFGVFGPGFTVVPMGQELGDSLTIGTLSQEHFPSILMIHWGSSTDVHCFSGAEGLFGSPGHSRHSWCQ